MATESAERLTPMFAQYSAIKKKYPDAILFFRMGDFYEMFFEDAITASRELQITLTARCKGTPNEAPMCGVPKHAVQSYLAQLIDRGYCVAICEQVEDPRAAKGLVKREVTCVVTPGTILDEGTLGARQHNFLGAVFCGMHDACAFAWADVSTGQWTGIQFKKQADLWQWVKKLSPAELLIMDGRQPPQNFALERTRLVRQPPINFDLKRAAEKLMEAQQIQELGALGLEDKPELTRACGAILAYLEQTQFGEKKSLMPFRPINPGKRMLIDEFTERNLEIFTRLDGRKGKGTLRHLLDDTATPMGGRLLEDMLRHPFRELKAIRQIQEVVAWFYVNTDARASTRSILSKIGDLERIIIRLSVGRGTPRDLLALRESLKNLPLLQNIFSCREAASLPPLLRQSLDNMADLRELEKLLSDAIVDDPPASITDGGIFRPGFNAELDAQIDLEDNSQRKLDDLFKKAQRQSGISKLKMGYNRVFGYYYEATRSNLPQELPEGFIRSQSLANSERFVTEDLKHLQEDILLASERRKQLEKEMFLNLREHLAGNRELIIQTADIVAHIDYWQTLATIGERENWAMPEMTEGTELRIKAGRHPVVESVIGSTNFVPNDFCFEDSKRLCLLTGPNMAGKSTILRQVALISLLAQIGSMVPADSATLGIVDRLFSRVGASDNLAQGQSTFMVEMMETARILRQATRRSLIILDEIGRGTSTFDGMAIAWAVVEDLASRCQGQLRTLFATHYHELTSLEGRIPGLFTMNIAVGAYEGREIIFLHRLVPGPSDKSYGVEVARLAGIPYPVVQRAKDILKNLEAAKGADTKNLPLPGLRLIPKDISPEIINDLKKIDLSQITPSDAYKFLKKCKIKLGLDE